MAKTSFQNIINELLEQIGTQVARGIAEGISHSPVIRSLERLSNRVGQTTKTSAPRAARAAKSSSTCNEKGCSLPARAKGMCSKHYQRLRYAEKHSSPIASAGRGRLAGKKVVRKASAGKVSATPKGPCKTKGCSSPGTVKGYCRPHFMAWIRSRKKGA